MGELTPARRRRLWLRLGARAAAALAAVWVCVTAGPTLTSLLAPFLLAFLMAWMLAPVVKWLHVRLSLPRRLAAVVALALVFGVLAGAVWWLMGAMMSEIAALAGSWQELVDDLESLLDTVNAGFSRGMDLLPASVQTATQGMEERLLAFLEDAIPRLLSRGMDAAANMARGLPSFFVATVVFVMAAYFFTADYPHIRAAVADALPMGSRVFLAQVRRAAQVGFGGYIKAQLTLSSMIFFILLALLLLIRQPYALLLAVALAVLDFIPILGSGTLLLPWAAADVVMGEFRHAVGLAAVWGVVTLFRRLAEPKVLGDQTGLSPLASLVSIYVGMRLGGVLGMVLGPVVCLVAVNLYRSGVLDPTLGDVRMAAADISAILSGGEDDAGP